MRGIRPNESHDRVKGYSNGIFVTSKPRVNFFKDKMNTYLLTVWLGKKLSGGTPTKGGGTNKLGGLGTPQMKFVWETSLSVISSEGISKQILHTRKLGGPSRLGPPSLCVWRICMKVHAPQSTFWKLGLREVSPGQFSTSILHACKLGRGGCLGTGL